MTGKENIKSFADKGKHCFNRYVGMYGLQSNSKNSCIQDDLSDDPWQTLQILLKSKIARIVLLSWMVPELFRLSDDVSNTFPFLLLFQLFIWYFAV